MARSVVTAVIVAVFLAFLAPVTAHAGAPPISWTACGPRLECASVPVPLDWRQPDGPTITLSVVRHLASRPEQRIGSLFFNPGPLRHRRLGPPRFRRQRPGPVLRRRRRA
jgi:hypothetical protein